MFRRCGSAFLQRTDGSENRRQWHPLPHSFSAGTGAGFGNPGTLGPKRYLNRTSCIHSPTSSFGFNYLVCLFRFSSNNTFHTLELGLASSCILAKEDQSGPTPRGHW